MKLEAVVVTEAEAEEEDSRRAFAKTVHITALHAHTKPMQPTWSSTGSQPPAASPPLRGRAPSASFAAPAAAAPSSPAAAAAPAGRMPAPRARFRESRSTAPRRQEEGAVRRL